MDENKNLQDFLEMKKRKEDAQKANKLRVEANSMSKIEGVIYKKFQTTMIGALARFEERFGYLWGQSKRPEELTIEEQDWREIWNLTRTEVLNNGNNQLRAIKEELARYTVSYNGYEVKLPVKSFTLTGESNKENSDG